MDGDELSRWRSEAIARSRPRASPPSRTPERLRALVARAPAGVQVVAWTPDDLERAHRSGNPIAREACATGVVLYGRLSRVRDRLSTP